MASEASEVVPSANVGIAVAILGNVAISVALNLQKYAHASLIAQGNQPNSAHAGGASEIYVASEVVSISDEGFDEDGVDAPFRHSRAASRSPAANLTLPLPIATPPSRSRTSTGAELPIPDESRTYLRNPIWWIGMILMLLGETGNFMAYGFAPASVIAPLGTVALISNAMIAPTCLGEKVRPQDLVGIALAVAGTIIIVTNSKPTSEISMDPTRLFAMIFSLRFSLYLAACLALLYLLYRFYDKFHRRTVVVDIGLVAIYGGWTVLSTKAVSTLLGNSWVMAFAMPIFYPAFIIMVATGILQIRYLNKALEKFDSTVVIPTQFVLFTISAILGSSMLYDDFDHQDAHRVLLFLFGCILTFIAVYMIGSSRHSSIQASGPERARLILPALPQTVFYGTGENQEGSLPPPHPALG